MLPTEVRELRQVLRYRNLLVRESVRLRNKTAGLLMECGAEYNKAKLSGKKYFQQLLATVADVPESVLEMLRLNRSAQEVFDRNQARLIAALREHPLLAERVRRLMTIPGVGEVTALTWALEVGDPGRFRSVKRAVSYCGLCSGQHESAGKSHRGPLSKQRNKHLQTILIEAAKLSPRWNEPLAREYAKAIARGADRNQATLSVARKLAAYLLAVDRSGKDFEPREEDTI